MTKDGSVDISAEGSAPFLQPQIMQRRSSVFAVYETEMDTLSTLNNVSTTAFALSGSFMSFSVGLYVQNSMSPAATARGQAIVYLGVPIGIVLALACGIIAIVALKKRGGTLHMIKSESRALNSHGNFEE